jgi:hypothetical protein
MKPTSFINELKEQLAHLERTEAWHKDRIKENRRQRRHIEKLLAMGESPVEQQLTMLQEPEKTDTKKPQKEVPPKPTKGKQ